MKEIEQSYIAFVDKETNKFLVVDFSMEDIARLKPDGVQRIDGKNTHNHRVTGPIREVPLGYLRQPHIPVGNGQHETGHNRHEDIQV